MSEHEPGVWARHQVPILLFAGLALYGAARFDATRPVAGVMLIHGFPLVALALASAPLRESSLFAPALVVGGLAAAAAELAIVRALEPALFIAGLVPPSVLHVVSVATLLGAAALQASAAGRGLRNSFAAWVGIVTVLALYLPGHAHVGKDALDAFVAAFLVSLFAGGGAGLLLGATATRLVRRPPAQAGK